MFVGVLGGVLLVLGVVLAGSVPSADPGDHHRPSI